LDHEVGFVSSSNHVSGSEMTTMQKTIGLPRVGSKGALHP